MTVEKAISHISSLPLDEQLQVLHTVWDRMPSEAGTGLTDSQRAELDRRMARYEAHPESGLTEARLRDQVRKARSQ